MSLLLPFALFGSMLLLSHATPAGRLARSGSVLGWLFTLLIAFVAFDSHLPALLSNLLEGAVAADLSVGIAAAQGCIWLATRPATLVVAFLLLVGVSGLGQRVSRGASRNASVASEPHGPRLWIAGHLIDRRALRDTAPQR